MIKNLFSTRILSLSMLLGLVFAVPAEAVSLYKWVDETGRVHYSQTPPDSSAAQSERMQVKDTDPYQSQQQANETETKTGETPTTTDEASQIVERRKKNCEIAKQNMEVFRSSERITQPDGTVVTLSDEMRDTKMKEAQAMINAYCN